MILLQFLVIDLHCSSVEDLGGATLHRPTAAPWPLPSRPGPPWAPKIAPKIA